LPCPGMPVSIQPGDPDQVRDLFDRIAPAYDNLNDLLSLGLHRLWKRQAIAWLDPRPGQRMLDLCCGTGDLALVLAEKVRPGGLVLGIDAAAAPLERARARARSQPWLPVEFREGDAAATGLAAGWADAAVMAYGLRNLPDAAAALAELRRLLRASWWCLWPGKRAWRRNTPISSAAWSVSPRAQSSRSWRVPPASRRPVIVCWLVGRWGCWSFWLEGLIKKASLA